MVIAHPTDARSVGKSQMTELQVRCPCDCRNALRGVPRHTGSHGGRSYRRNDWRTISESVIQGQPFLGVTHFSLPGVTNLTLAVYESGKMTLDTPKPGKSAFLLRESQTTVRFLVIPEIFSVEDVVVQATSATME